ncbi:MAG TPA: glycerol-3-phosphate 1-O-acyltransferase PlsY [Acidobacteriota bacterium]
MITGITGVVLAYLLGSIPFGYLLFRVRRGEDIRRHGSGNIGATNVARTLGTGAGLITLLLDAGKGALAVVALRGLGSEPAWLAAGAVAALVGHAFPLFLRFRGGKSVAVALGVFSVLTPLAIVPALGVFVLVLLGARFVSLASVLASLSLPLWAWGLHYPPPIVIGGALCAALIVIKHHENWRRLLAGTEHRFELRRARGSGT